jgi:hypothetical protein
MMVMRPRRQSVRASTVGCKASRAIGDNVTTISELTVYVAKSAIIKHQRENV